MAGAEDGGSGFHAFRGFTYVSHLRIFEPLEAFSDEDQLAFIEQRRRSRADVDAQDAQDALNRLARVLPDPFPRTDRNNVRVLHYPAAEGVSSAFYCPDELLVRSTLAAETLAQTMRGPLLNVLLPAAAREANQNRWDADKFAEAVGKIHTRTATWGIPFSWFVLIHEDDRSEVIEEHGRVLTVRTATPLQDAVERAGYAVASLVTGAPELDLLEDLTELSEWMTGFHENSILELDYGAVADAVYPDDSPHDVRLGIESLADGDLTGAAAAYRRLASRWIPIRQLGRAS